MHFYSYFKLIYSTFSDLWETPFISVVTNHRYESANVHYFVKFSFKSHLKELLWINHLQLQLRIRNVQLLSPQKIMTAEGRFKKQIENGWIYPSRLAGWGQQGAKIHPKKYCFQNKLQRWPEWSNSSRKLKTLIFHYWGGSG